MKKKLFIALAAFVFTTTASFGQQGSFVQYRVNKGDTVSKIARENQIPVSEILKYNPDAKSGINENSFLLIPTKEFLEKENNKSSNPLKKETVKQAVSSASADTHMVKPKETLYSISKKYGVSVTDLYSWNPSLKDGGLKSGSTIYIAAADTSKKQIFESKEVVVSNQQPKRIPAKLPSSAADTIKDINNIYFKTIDVEPQATLYSLAVINNTTVQRLLELNPELKDGLKSGQKIKVPAYGYKAGEKVVELTAGKAKPAPSNTTTITVEPKQTLYSISKQYGVSITDLVKQNPELNQGLRSGMELIIPTDGAPAVKKEESKVDFDIPQASVSTGGYVDFSTSVVRSNRKEIALLLPFNANKAGMDIDTRLQSDGFLNLTLDFYTGALMAIDYAKNLGLPLTVNVYDSNETKNSSSVKNIFNTENFDDTDVIIGPFFKANVDEAVKVLPNDKVVLISPLSNEKATPSNRLVQTMPYSDVLKSQLLDHFIRSGAKITVVVDDKKTSTKQFMQRHYPNVKVISTTLIKDLDKTLVSGQNNVFILDSNSIASALLLTDKLKNKVRDFNIQVASFDKNDIFDYSEIKIQTLVDLKYTFPSVTRDSEESKMESEFAKEYKDKYNVHPNRFATRGYDVTLDVILRMFQKDGFLKTAGQKTQEVENRFIYSRNPEGTIRNTGVYLMQYSDDLTVKVL